MSDNGTHSRLSRRRSVVLLLAAAVGLAPALASAQERALVIARDIDLNSLDPHRAWADTAQIFTANTYESLVGLAADNKTITPLLAKSWASNTDQSEFTITLDPEARFSDGSPVQAKDVKWSLERLKNLKGGASFLMDGLIGIDVQDERTVVVKLATPNSEFINILTAPATSIVNSDVAAEHGAVSGEDAAGADKSEDWFLSNTAGSGAYVLKEYRPGEALRFSANTNYYRAPGTFGEVVIRQTKDAVSQAQALQSGGADIAMQIDPDTATTITDANITVQMVPSYNFVYVSLSPGAIGGEKLVPEVRKAIGLALDYDGIIDFTVGGQGRKLASPIPNGFPGTEGLHEPNQDVEKAKQLLADAGLVDGIDLKAEYPNMNVYGVDISLLMQKVQQDLAKVNVRLQLTPLELSVWREHIRNGGIPVSALFYGPDYYGSAQYVQYFAMIEAFPWWKRAGGERNAAITNPKTSELLKKVLAAPQDKKDALYHDIALTMIEDRVIIPVVNPNLVLAHRADLSGIRYSACCDLPFREITKK